MLFNTILLVPFLMLYLMGKIQIELVLLNIINAKVYKYVPLPRKNKLT